MLETIAKILVILLAFVAIVLTIFFIVRDHKLSRFQKKILDDIQKNIERDREFFARELNFASNAPEKIDDFPVGYVITGTNRKCDKCIRETNTCRKLSLPGNSTICIDSAPKQ